MSRTGLESEKEESDKFSPNLHSFAGRLIVAAPTGRIIHWCCNTLANSKPPFREIVPQLSRSKSRIGQRLDVDFAQGRKNTTDQSYCVTVPQCWDNDRIDLSEKRILHKLLFHHFTMDHLRVPEGAERCWTVSRRSFHFLPGPSVLGGKLI